MGSRNIKWVSFLIFFLSFEKTEVLGTSVEYGKYSRDMKGCFIKVWVSFIPHRQFSSLALLVWYKAASGWEFGSGSMELQFKKSIICRLELKKRQTKMHFMCCKMLLERVRRQKAFSGHCVPAGDCEGTKVWKKDKPFKTQTSASPLITVLFSAAEILHHFTNMPFVFRAKRIYL